MIIIVTFIHNRWPNFFVGGPVARRKKWLYTRKKKFKKTIAWTQVNMENTRCHDVRCFFNFFFFCIRITLLRVFRLRIRRWRPRRVSSSCQSHLNTITFIYRNRVFVCVQQIPVAFVRYYVLRRFLYVFVFVSTSRMYSQPNENYYHRWYFGRHTYTVFFPFTIYIYI